MLQSMFTECCKTFRQSNEQCCKALPSPGYSLLCLILEYCISTVDGGNPAPVTAHSCSRETLSPPRPPNQCCFRGAFRWCRIMSIQLLFLQQRCNPSMLNGGREGCSHPGLRVVHDSFHPPSGETVFSASDGCFFLKHPGKICWFMDVQTQAWTNSLLHLPKPQSKRTFIFKAATHQTKTQQICFIWFMDVQTQAWTNSLLHVPKPQSKHTFIFTAAAHKQRSNIAASAPHVGKNWRSDAVCLAWCTILECASTPPEAKLHFSADENIRVQKHRVLHSARYSARHSARPQNAVNTTYLPQNDAKTKKTIFLHFFCELSKNAHPMVFTVCCGRALWRAL